LPKSSRSFNLDPGSGYIALAPVWSNFTTRSSVLVPVSYDVLLSHICETENLVDILKPNIDPQLFSMLVLLENSHLNQIPKQKNHQPEANCFWVFVRCSFWFFGKFYRLHEWETCWEKYCIGRLVVRVNGKMRLVVRVSVTAEWNPSF
jgi:hypothetical protein